MPIVSMGFLDDWSRPVYHDSKGRRYVDLNMGEGEPDIYFCSQDGCWFEPWFSANVVIVKELPNTFIS